LAGDDPEADLSAAAGKVPVDYFDFYLLHNVCETAYGFYTDEDLGVVEYLLEEKRAGASGTWASPPTAEPRPSTAFSTGGTASSSCRSS
jgi:hypothetical protein